MDSNKTGLYLKYAIGEIALVMIGILLALQVNNWNEYRKERIIEGEFLVGLKNEMLDNEAQMKRVIGYHELNIAAAETLIILFDSDRSQLSESFMDSVFSDLMSAWTYNPRKGKLNSIIMSGNLDYISSEDLKAYLTSFPDEADDSSEMNLNRLDLKYDRLDPLVDKLVSRKNRNRLQFSDHQISPSSFHSDYEKIFQSFEIENILSYMWSVAKFGLEEEYLHLESINQILKLIDDRLLELG